MPEHFKTILAVHVLSNNSFMTKIIHIDCTNW